MSRILTETLTLYRNAFRKTGESLARGWMTMVAVVGFGFLLVLATQIASPLGMAGGFLLGAVNALLVGATLSLIEQSISHARALTFRDILGSVGHYFWDVIGVGFILWLPLMALDLSMQTNPFGQLLSYAVFLLLFLLLNPAPEIIYQVRHDSPLEVFKTSYEFVLENWIEWFLPFAVILIPVVLSPMGLQLIPSQVKSAGEQGWCFPTPCAALHHPRKLAGLRGYPFLNQPVSRAAPHTAACRSHVVVSWPSLCIVAGGVTTPTPICLAIQVGTSTAQTLLAPSPATRRKDSRESVFDRSLE